MIWILPCLDISIKTRINVRSIASFKDYLAGVVQFIVHRGEIADWVRKVARDVTVENYIESAITERFPGEWNGFARNSKVGPNVLGLIWVELDAIDVKAMVFGKFEKMTAPASNFQHRITGVLRYTACRVLIGDRVKMLFGSQFGGRIEL